jgi:hypothetical protein
MATVAQPTVNLQGVASPDVVVDPNSFYPATRRLTYPMKAITPIAGYGSTDSVQLRQTGIVAGLYVRVTGTLVWGGTITGSASSWRWPYNLIRALRVSANGQSNLINCNGLALKGLEFSQNNDLNDRGVSHTISGATGVTQGTLSTACEDWGTSGANQLGPGTTIPAVGTYTVDLEFFVPIAADQVSLVGSIFAQTAATNLTLDIDWETQNNLFTVGGAATLTTNLSYQVQGVVYSIPVVGGKAVVPDLSQFHQVAQFRTSALGQGDNELLLPGTGVGRKLLRVAFSVSTGAAPGTPLAMNAANYGALGWRYGGNDTPEQVSNGTQLRYINERQYSTDMGRNWGLAFWDFCSQFALRDVVDEGATSDLRLLINLVNPPTTPFAEVVQETLFAAPVGA